MGHNDVALGIPRVGLSELYAWPCVRLIERHGGTVRFSCAITALDMADGRVQGVVLDDATRIQATVVLAAPPPAVSALLPAGHPLGVLARRFEPSPYVSCFLWFDRKLTTTRFWARPWSPDTFNTDFYDLSNVRQQCAGPAFGMPPGAPPHLQRTVPPAHAAPNQGSMIATNIIWSDRVAHLHDDALVAATLAEIADFVPEARQAKIVAAAVHRIPMSVPCARPGIETIRPPVGVSPGLFLAGDWVDTGLPFCMESATRAGALAAEAVLRRFGRHRVLALPVPEPAGLSRMLRRTSWCDGVEG
jgi:glycine/D-amino acid oxidase-like deaminating enzyme